MEGVGKMNDTEKATGTVYKIVNLYNGKFYVGSTVEVQKRISRHLHELINNKHHNILLQRAWNKYGIDYFDLLIVDENISEAHCRIIEQSILDEYINGGVLYNTSPMATGGDLISAHPDNGEIRNRISLGMSNRYKNMPLEDRLLLNKKFQGEANGMFGRGHTREAREKMTGPRPELSELLKGIPKSEDHRRKMSINASKRVGKLNPFYGRQHTIEAKQKISKKNVGRLPPNLKSISIDGIIYGSIADASRELGIPTPTIHWRLNSSSDNFKDYFYL